MGVRVVLGASAALGALAYMTETRLQLGTITLLVALGAVAIGHKSRIVQYTGLSAMTWSVVAAQGTSWGTWFALSTSVVALAVASQRLAAARC